MDDCRPQRALIAQGPVCKLEQCDCGTIHLTIGPLTMRLHPMAITSIWNTLGEALARLSPAHDELDARASRAGWPS